MALPVNFRVLFVLLGIVMLLNFSQFFLSVRRESERKRPYPIYPPVVGVAGIPNSESMRSSINASDIVSYDSMDEKPDNNGVVDASSTEKETCANTDYLEGELLVLCPQVPPGLGALDPSVPLKLTASDAVLAGGYHKTKDCTARQQLAVIIPFSKNYTHLSDFLDHIHTFLIMQQSDYQVFLVKYENKTEPFNRGNLFNIGVVEAQKLRSGWHCLVFHDPQLLPLDSRNMYRCNWYPRQLVATVDANGTKYHPAVGGALSITPELFEKMNGFSNALYGRDEDFVDFHKRLRWANITLERTDPAIGLYKGYVSAPEANSTYSVVVSPFHLVDGLTSLSYELKDIQVHHDPRYTLITVRDEAPVRSGKLNLAKLIQ